ncbi:5'-methylthioadenosine/adenosylhomocysteine nucleosidase [Campylobacter sp. FMV-PI01]|uniref:adenosylhomocysteine nucleosidase n=1 Tax=Campylobacter portucalensis TaxID=2608384 RepID=A0A6L5WHE7_9BACT|nr:5'-methylthioadenosine/adenosylhomocysteine nucleosidase [Campylobacter portucalensis]MSN96648.1 5'-methylthioadenosine/adenosylhomocysteine nucleosidase [Campylobacter portucalensis]
MKIAILGAMPEEITPLLEKLDYIQESYANNVFYFAKFKNHDLIIAYSKIGKVNSALSATLMIEKYGAEILFFTGVAGSLNPNFKISDMVYGTKLLQHDIDISAFGHPYGYVPDTPIFINSDENLNQLALKVAKSLNLTIYPGIIASGDQFICDDEKKKWIKGTFDADLAEMEGASVALVCHSLNTPFFILRSVSDEAGTKAEFDFDKFMISSAKISANFVLKMVENL